MRPRRSPAAKKAAPGIDGQTPFAALREQAHPLLALEPLRRRCRHLADDGSLDEGAFQWREVDEIMQRARAERL